jgi:hypothetical protein
MSFSYDPITVPTNPIHEVRFLTGQTEEATSQIEDEEIQYLLDKNDGSVEATVTNVLNTLLKKAAHAFDMQTGEVSESQSQRYAHLKELIGDPPNSDIESVIATPVGMHAGGLDSEEFALRKADRTVVQGFSTNDADPWDIGEEEVYGVSTSNINSDGKTVSTNLNIGQP